MKQAVLSCLLLFTILCFSACHNSSKENKSGGSNAASTEKAPPEPELRRYYKRLSGKLNNKQVILNLIKYPAPPKSGQGSITDHYRGVWLEGESKPPLNVAGRILADSSIQLIVYDHYLPVDTLKGHFTDLTFTGRFENQKRKGTHFNLKERFPSGSSHWEVASFIDSVIVPGSSAGQSFGPKGSTQLMALWPKEEENAASYKLLKDSVSRGFFGMKDSFSDPKELLKMASDSFLSKYNKLVQKVLSKKQEIRPSMSWTWNTQMDVYCNIDHKVSLVYTQYEFQGGAHGLQTVLTLNVNTKKGKMIRLSDLFKSGYEDKLLKKLEQQLRKQYDIPKHEPLNGEKGLLFKDHLPITSNFYLTPAGIGFIYNPYEIAPYVVGEINLYLPFKELKGILKEG